MPAEAGPVHFGDFELDEARFELRRGGVLVELQATPFRLLQHLLRERARVVPKEELLAVVWPEAVVSDAALSSALKEVRRALGDDGKAQRWIQTLKGRGMRFVGHVEDGAARPRHSDGQPVAPPPSPLEAGAMPFVGREAALARLERAFARAEAGEGRALFVTGEPGIGKTRLVEELARRVRPRGARILAGRCFEDDAQRPYGPFAEILDDYVAATEEAQLAADLFPYGAQLAPLSPRLRERLPELPELPRLSGEAERERLFYAFVRLLLSIAGREPVLLFLDDLHWADGATVALLRQIARSVRKDRLLLLGAYRDTELRRDQPLASSLVALAREGDSERVALGGLAQAGVAALLGGLTRGGAGEGLAARLTEVTGGNPFFVREYLLHLAETRRPDHVLDELEIPAGVREIIVRRLARLSDRAARLVAVAAAFPAGFSFEIARGVAELEEGDALDALDEAIEAQLVRAASGDRYGFAHDLIRQTAHAALNPARQARLHRRIAEAMESACGAGSGEHAAEIAWQFHRSRALPGAERGLVHCLAAADAAERAAAQRDVAAFTGMALALLPEGDPRRPRLLARRALALAWSEDAAEASRLGSEAADLLAASEGGEAAAAYLAELVVAVRLYARTDSWRLAEQGLRHLGPSRDLTWAYLADAVESAKEAADPTFPGIPLDSPARREITQIVRAEPASAARRFEFGVRIAFASREEALAYGGLDATHWLAGDLRGALRLFLERLGRELRGGELAEAAYRLAQISRIHAALGDLAAAEGCHAWGRRLAAGLTHASVVRINLGAARAAIVYAAGVGFEQITRVESQAESAPLEHAYARANQWAHVAFAHAHLGHPKEALRSLERTLPAIERAPGWAVNYTRVVHFAAETLWTLDRAEHVDVIERNLREKTLAPDFRTAQTDARLSLARLLALQGREDEAAEWFARAREVLDEQGARPLRALADYDEARMLLRRGEREGARSLLELALVQFRAIGMPGWEQRARSLLTSAPPARSEERK